MFEPMEQQKTRGGRREKKRKKKRKKEKEERRKASCASRPKVTLQPRGTGRPHLKIYLLTLSSYRGSLYSFLEIRLRLMTLLRLPFPTK